MARENHYGEGAQQRKPCRSGSRAEQQHPVEGKQVLTGPPSAPTQVYSDLSSITGSTSSRPCLDMAGGRLRQDWCRFQASNFQHSACIVCEMCQSTGSGAAVNASEPSSKSGCSLKWRLGVTCPAGIVRRQSMRHSENSCAVTNAVCVLPYDPCHDC